MQIDNDLVFSVLRFLLSYGAFIAGLGMLIWLFIGGISLTVNYNAMLTATCILLPVGIAAIIWDSRSS